MSYNGGGGYRRRNRGEISPIACIFVHTDSSVIDNQIDSSTGTFKLKGLNLKINMPDPHGEETFASAKLRWSWPEGTPAAGLRRLHQDLLSARREWAELRDPTVVRARLAPDPEVGPVLEVRRAGLVMYFNLSELPTPLPEGAPRGAAVRLSTEGTVYGGSRVTPVDGLLPWECVVFGP